MSETEVTKVTPPAVPAQPPMTRLRAALIHFVLSAAIFLVVIVPLLLLWYPPLLFVADGGLKIFRIAFGVDVVLGPLLTLVVFKAGKKSLKLDLGIIGAIQFAALIAGAYIMHQERPLFLVFAEDRFASVSKSVIDSERPLDELQKFDNHRPPRVFVRLPDDPKETFRLKMALSSQSQSLFRLADRYEPMTPENLAKVMAQSLDMPSLVKPWPEWKAEYDAFMAAHQAESANLAFIPLICRDEALIVALNRTNGEVVDWLHIPLSKSNLIEKPAGAK